MIPSILNLLMRGWLTEVEAPTPIANGEVLSISNYGCNVNSAGFMVFRQQVVSNFLQSDFTPFTQQYSAGTTNVLEPAKQQSYPVKTFTNRLNYTPAQIRQCEAIQDWGLFQRHSESVMMSWDRFVENAAVFGIPSAGIPGLLNSPIPQAIENANFYNGSLNGVQMVDIFLNWASYMYISTNFRFKPQVLALSPRLVDILGRTPFSQPGTLTPLSALDVLNERMAKRYGNISRVVEVPIMEAAKFMAFLPADPEKIGLGVIDMTYDDYNSSIETTGGCLGVVIQHSEAGLIVRTPNS
jgi:hypothetical protein